MLSASVSLVRRARWKRQDLAVSKLGRVLGTGLRGELASYERFSRWRKCGHPSLAPSYRIQRLLGNSSKKAVEIVKEKG